MLKPFVSLATHRFMIATVLVIVSMWISYMYIQRQSETIHKLEVDLGRVAQEIATRDVVISNLEFRLNVLQETIDVESVVREELAQFRIQMNHDLREALHER